MPKIEDQDLTEKDIGRSVVYHTDWNKVERGVLSSFNETGIWVRFNAPNGEKCPPETLRWS